MRRLGIHLTICAASLVGVACGGEDISAPEDEGLPEGSTVGDEDTTYDHENTSISPWELVDRLANIAAAAFGTEPRVHVHEARAFLGVLMAGPRLAQLTAPPRVPDQVAAFNQSHAPSPARIHERDPSIEPARDDWPFLYLRDRHVPRHYVVALAVVLIVSAVSVFLALSVMGTPGASTRRWPWR